MHVFYGKATGLIGTTAGLKSYVCVYVCVSAVTPNWGYKNVSVTAEWSLGVLRGSVDDW